MTVRQQAALSMKGAVGTNPFRTDGLEKKRLKGQVSGRTG